MLLGERERLEAQKLKRQAAERSTVTTTAAHAGAPAPPSAAALEPAAVWHCDQPPPAPRAGGSHAAAKHFATDGVAALARGDLMEGIADTAAAVAYEARAATEYIGDAVRHAAHHPAPAGAASAGTVTAYPRLASPGGPTSSAAATTTTTTMTTTTYLAPAPTPAAPLLSSILDADVAATLALAP